ncbi:MAG TPA: DUF5063 domain-containing protein [Candidatus Avimuribaculum pullicola]|nr:DUF5063 domain-containing protein [Candidatus Avimuribaculum pullicola]
MTENNSSLNPNSLAFIALANEYCHALENIFDYDDRQAFIAEMLRLLPRLYMSASDIKNTDNTDSFIDSYLDENDYDTVRGNVSRMMADEDIYLEVFMDDMKYSDTPIGTSVSENLADIYQPLYNFVATVKDATDDTIAEAIIAIKADFDTYWGQTLCNVLRALHSIYYTR